MRWNLLIIGIVAVAGSCDSLYAQVNFGEVFALSKAQITPQPEPLPAVRPIAPVHAMPAPAGQPMSYGLQQPMPNHVSGAPQTVDFNQIFQDPAACGDQCQPCASGCNCKEDNCLEKLVYGDYMNEPVVERQDPLVAGSIPGLYETPDWCRGFWSTYPGEKARHTRKIQSQLNDPPDCQQACCGGPQLVYPAGHPCEKCPSVMQPQSGCKR